MQRSYRWVLFQRTQNAFHHSGEIGIDIRISEPKNRKSLRLQKSVANLIRSGALRHPVLTAIRLDAMPTRVCVAIPTPGFQLGRSEVPSSLYVSRA
jgi:hypothetical protein